MPDYLGSDRRRNILLNESELKHGFSVLKSFPVNVQFSPTERCNLSCIHCYRRKWGKTLYREDMSLEILNTDAIQMSVSRAVSAWIVSGGEIFLYKKLKSLIDFFKKNKVNHLNTITNGTAITEKMINYLVEKKFDEIKFSIDGATAKTVNLIRGRRVFERAIQTIRLINLKKEKQHRFFPRLIITMVIMKNNYFELPKLLSLSKKLHIYRVEVHHLQQLNDETSSLSMYNLQKDYDEIIKKSLKYAEKNKIILIHPPLFKGSVNQSNTDIENYERCSQPWNFFLINQIGDVYPCCYLWGKPFGNVYKSSFQEIWNGKEFTNLRKNITKNIFAPTCLRSPCPKAELYKKVNNL